MVEKNQDERRNLKQKDTKKVSREPKIQKKNQTTRNGIRKQADDKSARIKKAKDIRKAFTWTILIGIIVGILVFLCKAELFNICDIEITGNNQITQEKLLELSNINIEDNIFLANTIKAKNKIKENPYTKEVNIKRILPDKIKIEITEKQKAYRIQIDEKTAYIDVNGFVLEVSENKLDEIIELQGFSTIKEEIEAGKTLNEEDLEILKDIQKILKSGEKSGINNKIASINIKDKNDYILNLPLDKKIVYIGNTSNLSTKMLYIKDILEKTLDKEGKIFVNGRFNDGFDPYFREEANT